MRALLVIDSFKGCLGSAEAGQAALRGLLDAGLSPDDVTCIPVSDGGEGFAAIVGASLGGRAVTARCRDPFGRPLVVRYFLCDGGRTAIIDSASVIGLDKVEPMLRNPLILTSFGLGQLIRHAASRGARDIYVGLGGTATCDGGVGMMQALGVRFFTRGEVPDDAEFILSEITRIDADDLWLGDAAIHCMCDTSARFSGRTGAAVVYGPQKGLAEDKVDAVDAWMHSLSFKIREVTGVNLEYMAGGGAAGGVAGALAAFCGADILSGARGVLRITGVERAIRQSVLEGRPYDLVVTGEGRLDHQTHTGKLPWEVCRLVQSLRAEAPAFNPRLVCLCGTMGKWRFGGFDDIVRVTPPSMLDKKGAPLPEALGRDTASDNIRRACASLITD